MVKLSEETLCLNQLLRQTHSIYYSAAAKLQLSDSIYDILYCVKALGEGCLQKDISEKASLNKQTVNSGIRQLEQKGYISLVAGRGREKHIYLTDNGKVLMEEKMDLVFSLEQEAWDELSDDEQNSLLRSLDKWSSTLKRNFERIGNQE